MLTRKQYELLMFIHERLSASGVSPSFDEMKDALGLKSKSGIHRLITGLEERGFIKRLPHRARALEILRLPDNMQEVGRPRAAAGPAKADHEFMANVVRGDFSGAKRGAAGSAAEAIELPLYGRIAAGTPIDALRDPDTTFGVPTSLLGAGEHYLLEIDGDSMVDAGILDSDLAIIQRCDIAENGSIVVALIDENEVTLKQLRRKGDSVALEPANPSYETRIFGPDRVQIQGRLVGLIRRY
ncbi:MAG: transcriptional repressor LexA [Kiloniellales bacterium]